MNTPSPSVQLIPIFEDNYVFAVINSQTKMAILVDPGEASACVDFLRKNSLTLAGILITHHHHDHVGGLTELKDLFNPPIYAPRKNALQIPAATHFVEEGEQLQLSGFTFSVLELPGHTLGHVAYWSEEYAWLFSGDVLFGLGCGRLFEGTYEQAFASLQRIKSLPENSLIYCTHEYTEMNLKFCKMLSSVDDTPIWGGDEILEIYENELEQKRKMDLPSVPLNLNIEKNVNPFLLAKNVQQFTYLRELRNKN